MKRITYLAILALLGLSSCTQEFNYDPTQEIQENAENIFGLIDPNQDWRTTTSGTVTVTANAPLSDIAKVQILTESPFFNDQAKILAEAEVTAGQTVTLSYDAPRSNTRVIAACVDSNGKYYIQGFNIGDENVSFKSSSTPVATRAAVITISGSELPNISLDFNESFLSYNAERTIKNTGSWANSNWENDRLWQPTGESSNGWTISNSTIYRDATALSEDEATTLQDIFKSSLLRDDPQGYNGRRNNIEYINKSRVVNYFNNHLVSNGKNVLTLSPVQLASTEAFWCDIYYYYYKKEDIPTGTSEADYIKSLPKFKAIDLDDERNAFRKVTTISKDKRDENFLRLHEYLLPFYGNASDFTLTSQPSTLKSHGYETDGKFYRIRNFSGNSSVGIPESNHYFTYGDTEHNMKNEDNNNIESQIWQVFMNANDNTVMLYNVGSNKFLRWEEKGFIGFKDITDNSLKKYTCYITDEKKNSYAFDDITKQKVFILDADRNNFIKALLDKNRSYLLTGGTDLSNGKRTAREWTFEDYSEFYSGNASPISDFELPIEKFPTVRITPPSKPVSAIIPEGYRIGFMIRKDGGAEANNNDGNSQKQGCLYGFGELNKEINTYGQFFTSVDKYGMEPNSPRIAAFEANGKIYLCFEEGADTQFSDVIVEIGSSGEPGVNMFDDVLEIGNQPYTMCFEDRPNIADYDMNDVVLRCVRTSPTTLQLTIVATGAQDEVFLNGIEGRCTSGTDFNNKEVHNLLNVPAGTYVNTEPSASVLPCVSAEYEVGTSTTIPEFMSKIYIENHSQNGKEIRVPEKGEPPFALIVPGDFDYPAERISIVYAYKAFSTWANNAYDYGRWLDSYDTSKLYINPFNRKTN